MARYIDADKIRYYFNDMVRVIGREFSINYIVHIIDKQPTADVVEVKQIEIIRDDLKWWLETNAEKGVVHIPKYVVENMIAKMDGGKQE